MAYLLASVWCVHNNKVSAIFVPATAGIRRRQGLLGLNGRKGCVGGLQGIDMKAHQNRYGRINIRLFLRVVGGSGTRL